MTGLRQQVLQRWQDPVQQSGLYMLATTAVTSLFGFAYWLLAARLVPPAAVGLAAACVSTMTLASFASNLGANSALLQLLPRAGPGARGELLGSVLALGMLAGAVGGGIAVALMSLDGGTRLRPEQAALLIAGVMAATTQVCLSHAWIALRRGVVMLATESGFAVVKLLALAVAPAWGTTGLLVGWVGSSLVMCTVSLLLLHGIEGVTGSLRNVGARLRQARSVLAGNHFINIANILPVYVLPVVVAARLGQAEAAYFYTAWQIGSFFYVIAASTAGALQAEGARDGSGLLAHLRRSIGICCALLVPVSLVVAAAGHQLLALYGPGYVAGYGLLVWMSLAAQPDVVTNLYGAFLRVTRRFRTAAAMSWVGAVLKLGLTWVLLDLMGLIAAGVAFFIAQVAIAAWCAWDVRSLAARGRARRHA